MLRAIGVAIGAALVAALAWWAAPGAWRHVWREWQWRKVRRETEREPYDDGPEWT